MNPDCRSCILSVVVKVAGLRAVRCGATTCHKKQQLGILGRREFFGVIAARESHSHLVLASLLQYVILANSLALLRYVCWLSVRGWTGRDITASLIGHPLAIVVFLGSYTSSYC